MLLRKTLCVKQIDVSGNLIKIWGSSGIASDETNIPRHQIADVCRGKQKLAGGFQWSYYQGDDLPNEEWKNHPKIKNLKVSNKGRVVTSKMAKSYGGMNREGYYIFRMKRVHRLVLETFVGFSDLECDHINQKRDDNRLENLRWTTKLENNRNKKKGQEKFKHCISCTCNIK